MYRLQNPVRHYAWGSGFHIPRLLGQDQGEKPWAEMWLGAHPGDPSVLDDGRRLDDAVSADPEGMLGREVAAAFGRLPFLMKLLAAGQPLSLQVHPSSEQARLRFAEQDAAGIPMDAPERSYQDAWHKPELIYALTRFEGMAGFRDVERTVPILRELRLPWLDELADRLDGTQTPFQTLREVVTDVLSWSGPELEQRLADLAGGCQAAERRHHAPPQRRRPPVVAAESVQRESLRVFQQTQPLVRRYPADPGVVVTLLLNHVVLAAGEAMFVPAGVIHAYTAGFGVEIMASSDNVLRAGLTPKRVDIPELLRITDFRPTPPPRWAPRHAGEGIEVFTPPVSEFELATLSAVEGVDIGAGPAIVLCLDDRAEVVQNGDKTVLTEGAAVLVTGAGAQVHVPRGRAAVGRCPLAQPNGG
jgi:mannose-6-phosphate isomerase